MNMLLLLCSCMAFRLAFADVSHLNAKYLPPRMQNNGFIHGNGPNTQSQQKTTTSIEKQILRELPEQIEYGQSAQYGSDIMPMMNNMMMMMMQNDVTMMMPMPAEVMQPPPMEKSMVPSYLHNMPSTQYLTPKMDHPAPQQQEMIAQHPQQHSISPMLPTQYLPPTFMPSGQYEQQMQQVPKIYTSMSAPPNPEMPEIEKQQMMEYTQVEPQPAHMLTAKGYQYKTGAAFPTPMLSSTSGTRRFRLKH